MMGATEQIALGHEDMIALLFLQWQIAFQSVGTDYGFLLKNVMITTLYREMAVIHRAKLRLHFTLVSMSFHFFHDVDLSAQMEWEMKAKYVTMETSLMEMDVQIIARLRMGFAAQEELQLYRIFVISCQ